MTDPHEEIDFTLTPGCQSLNECRENIRMLADSISKDVSSTFVNEGRINSLRVLLTLFEDYNSFMKKQGRK